QLNAMQEIQIQPIDLVDGDQGLGILLPYEGVGGVEIEIGRRRWCQTVQRVRNTFQELLQIFVGHRVPLLGARTLAKSVTGSMLGSMAGFDTGMRPDGQSKDIATFQRFLTVVPVCIARS